MQSRDRYCFAAPSSSITKSNRPPTSPYSTASACVCFCNTAIVFLSRGISHSGLSCTPFPLPPASPPCLRPPRRPKPYRSALFGEAHRNKCEARSSRTTTDLASADGNQLDLSTPKATHTLANMAALGEDLLGVVNKLQDLVFNTIGNDSLDLPQIVRIARRMYGILQSLTLQQGHSRLPVLR